MKDTNKVLGKYRPSSTAGKVGLMLVAKKNIPFRSVERMCKTDKVNPIRLVRRMARHGRAVKGWTLTREGKVVHFKLRKPALGRRGHKAA